MALDSVLAILSAVGEITVLGLLLHRKVGRLLPLFGVYLGWTLLSDLAALYLQRTLAPDAFFRWYLVEVAIDSVLVFVVLVELAWSVLRPVRSSLPRAALYVLAAVVAIAGAIIWPLVGTTVPPRFGPDSSLLFHMQETSAILRVGCFLVLASFSQLLSIGWRDRELQVATGFGFYSIISLIVAVLHSSQVSPEQYHWLDIATSLSYLGTLSYWVLSFSAKEQERKDFSPQMQQLLLLMSGGARASRTALSDLPSKHTRKKD